MTSETVGLGIIGAGAMGRLHARLLVSAVPGARLLAVADADPAAGALLAEEFGLQDAYVDAAELLYNSGVEAFIIATPGETHGAIIEAAAAEGKHVFCEKPLEVDLTRLDRALDAVRSAGVKLQVGFNRRFDHNFRAVHDSVAGGRVGDPFIIHLISRDPLLPRPPRDVGPLSGLLFDTTIHDLDMVRFLTGAEFESVYALPASFAHRTATIDSAVFSFRLTSGAIGTIDNSQAVYGYDQRAEVFGPAGAVSTGNERAHLAVIDDEAGRHRPRPLAFYPERYEASYVAELTAFIEAVRTQTPPPVTGEDGRAATVAALAAQRSFDEGRPVRIAEIQGGVA